MWEDVVENGNCIPLDENLKEIPHSRWSDEDKKTYLLNSKAGNAIICALLEEKYTKMHSAKSVKQMQDTFALTYEGFKEVERNKLNLIACQYQLFNMGEIERIQVMYGRFQTILNERKFVGYEIVIIMVILAKYGEVFLDSGDHM